MVKDPSKSADFYEDLGFLVSKREADLASVRVNWFWVDFVKAHEYRATGNDGQYLYVSVADVDETYKSLTEKKLKPTKPEDYKTGRRETMISDPDGYKLVFFQKVKL